MHFVLGHPREDRGAFPIVRRQALQVIAQVRFDLALGLANEAQALGVGAKPREHADAEAAGVPKRSEQARAAAELLDARGAPSEVVALLARRVGEQLAGRGRAREQRLAV